MDEPKRASIEDILRVRPIYTLQGPPGTGKTTLVAWLLREIVAEDPVVQVLVTAQAHGAVDVLRSKVGEAFRDVPEEQRPLEIRLRSVHKSDIDEKDGQYGWSASSCLTRGPTELRPVGQVLGSSLMIAAPAL
ncbi:AAA domain-containing protein [Kibdelosporangium aridum]|uniref:AAA domain-containing protein n=1 Tax=Kibdelosporangium aridum TaxID=2030 RepID=UPI0035E8E077